MDQDLPPQRVLASVGCGWRVCKLTDDRIHIKLRETDVCLSLADFQAFCALVNQVCICQPLESMLLSQVSEQRTIVYHAALRGVIVQFDQIVLHLAPRDLPLLVMLCRRAGETLMNVDAQRRHW